MTSSFVISFASKRITTRFIKVSHFMKGKTIRSQSTTSSTSFTVTSSKGQNGENWRERKIKEFSTSPLENFEIATDEHHEALLSAYEQVNNFMKPPAASGYEISMDEAALVKNDVDRFDKILVLINECDRRDTLNEQDINESMEDTVINEIKDPLLSPKGIGKALNIARSIVKHANKADGLVPELFIVSPFRRTTMTSLLTFPKYAPGSIHEKPWLCHPQCGEDANGKVVNFLSQPDDLNFFFRGVDYSLYKESFEKLTKNNRNKKTLVHSKIDLLRQTDYFLDWLRQRDERVISVASQSTWFQSFCGFTIDYHACNDSNKKNGEGDLRVVGIKFRQ